jgi:(p)ppGpp synthase/HD superfamily hydrolase
VDKQLATPAVDKMSPAPDRMNTEGVTMINTAEQLSKQWHEGQVDKAGKPYFTHPARVAKNVQTWPGFTQLSTADQESLTCAAYLHDVIEDCDVTAVQLREHGFSEDTIDAVLLLSKNNDFTTIEAYCARIALNPLARAVKLADLSDNCNLRRQAELRAQGIEVDEAKYPKVLSLLKPTLQEIAWFQVVIRIEPTP